MPDQLSNEDLRRWLEIDQEQSKLQTELNAGILDAIERLNNRYFGLVIGLLAVGLLLLLVNHYD